MYKEMNRRTYVLCLLGLCLFSIIVLSNLQSLTDIRKTPRIPTVYVVTPTYARLEQKAELTRFGNTLQLVPQLHWIIIEDSANKTALISNFLAKCKIPYTHLNTETPKTALQKKKRHRGVAQRNAGLDWIRGQHCETGVVYFADDDNTYDTQVFEEMRYTKKVSVWPVGLVGGLMYESPMLEEGKVIGWRSVSSHFKTFALDMAGFAISVKLLKEKSRAKFAMSANRGKLEDNLLRQLNITHQDLEPKADGCTKVLVWHTKTKQFMAAYEKGMKKRRRNTSYTSLEV